MRKDITIARVKWGVRDVAKMLAVTIILPIAVFVLLIALSHFGLLPAAVRETLKNNDFAVNLGFEIFVTTIEILMIIWLVRKYQLKLSDLGFRKFSVLKAIGYVVAGLILFIVLVAIVFAIVAVLAPAIDLNQAQDVAFSFGHSNLGLGISFVATVLLAPIVEELYFRGLMLPAVAKRFGWIFGVLGSSVFFAILHLQANVIIYTFLLGVVLCFFYIRLKSIIPGIFLHMINNLIAFVVIAGLIK